MITDFVVSKAFQISQNFCTYAEIGNASINAIPNFGISAKTFRDKCKSFHNACINASIVNLL